MKFYCFLLSYEYLKLRKLIALGIIRKIIEREINFNLKLMVSCKIFAYEKSKKSSELKKRKF